VLLGLALPGLAPAQTQNALQGLLSIQRAPTDPKWQAGMAEDVEILRRLLAQKLGHGRGSSGLTLWDADGGGNKLSAGTMTFNADNNLDLSGSGTLALGDVKLSSAGHEESAPEGVYLKGHGVVYTVTLTGPSPTPKARPKGQAAAPLSEWDRARKELRGEKVEAPAAAPEPPSLADVIVKILAENGRHFALLEPEESITVVVTFRGEKPTPATASQPSGPGGVIGGMPGEAGIAIGGLDRGVPVLSGIPGVGRLFTLDNPVSGAGDAPLGGGAPPGGQPTSAQDYVLLGDLHMKQGKYRDAATAYHQACSIIIDNAPAQDPRSKDPNKVVQEAATPVLKKEAQAWLSAGYEAKARELLDAVATYEKGKTPPGAAVSAASRPSALPAKLIVSAPKKLLDQVGAGKMTFEEFKKGATVDSIGGEK